MHLTHFDSGYIWMDVWLRTKVRKPTVATLWVTLYFFCQQGIFYMHHPTDRIVHTMVFVRPSEMDLPLCYALLLCVCVCVCVFTMIKHLLKISSFCNLASVLQYDDFADKWSFQFF